MKNKKVLILIPCLSNSGGVANYYSIMQHKFSFTHTFFILGNRERSNHNFSSIFNFVSRVILDYLRFIKTLWCEDYDLILVNPSLNFKGICRDYIFYLISRLYRKKTVIFFRGWNNNCAFLVFHSRWKILFKPILEADAFIVLSKKFSEFISPFSKSQVFIETTVFDESILPDNFELLYEHKRLDNVRLLFLSRIEKDKGVFDAINAYKYLREKGLDIELIIAGSGSEEDNVKKLVNGYDNPGLCFVGRVSGDAKKKLLLSSSILLFPSRHAEGMPNTVLEAMGCGQVIISSKKGGMNDFFNGDKMGAELIGNYAEEIICHVEEFIGNKDALHKISKNNYFFAKKYFYSHEVSQRVDEILDVALGGQKKNNFWLNE